MFGQVSLGRRNLFEDRRRAFLAISGVGAGLLMVMLMSAVFVGMTQQETAYIDQSSADVFVSQEGVKTMHMSTTNLPFDTIQKVRAVPGVAWAEPLRFATTVVGGDDLKLITYLFGYDPNGHAGPRSLDSGTAPGKGEVVIDATGAAQLHLGVGDTIRVGSTPLKISGLSRGLTGMGNTTMFITGEQFAEMSGIGVNFILVGAKDQVSAAVLATAIAAAVPSTTAQTRSGFSFEQAEAVKDLYTDVIRTMIMVGFLIALALVALTLSTVTASNIREYGIVKALGATTGRLAGVVICQAVWAVVIATVAASILAIVLASIIGRVLPNFALVVEPSAIIMTAAGALFVGVPAALAPLRRVLRVDPASAFRGAA